MEGDGDVDVIVNSDSISIHSLRVEGDIIAHILVFVNDISIHSLRVEGDDTKGFDKSVEGIFQSTPSVWRETHCSGCAKRRRPISIHSLRVEGDYKIGVGIAKAA